MKLLRRVVGMLLAGLPGWSALALDNALIEQIRAETDRQYSALFALYRHFHAHPELSLQEEKTSARFAAELRDAGFSVTERVGGFGVVGVRQNGPGPTVLLRADMDALPVKEQTGLPYASTVTARDAAGNEVGVMHACGHDAHMTCVLGAARVLARLTNHWRGTLVVIGQPAEESGGGARRMVADGLFTRFPRPDFALALHVNAELSAGTIGYTPGFSAANVDTVRITVRGIGGHGAHPHRARDPVVLAAHIVLALQTIVSREVKAGEPAVVTVGAIHGGTRPNIIPDEVKLELTVRSYAEEVRRQVLAAISRIVRGQALAAGVPEDRLPVVDINEDYTPAVYNDPALTERVATVFRRILGDANVVERKPSMGGEDFGEYGRTPERVPICMFSLGTVARDRHEAAQRAGLTLPGLHSPEYAPEPEGSLKTGVAAFAAAVLELMPAR